MNAIARIMYSLVENEGVIEKYYGFLEICDADDQESGWYSTFHCWCTERFGSDNGKKTVWAHTIRSDIKENTIIDEGDCPIIITNFDDDEQARELFRNYLEAKLDKARATLLKTASNLEQIDIMGINEQ